MLDIKNKQKKYGKWFLLRNKRRIPQSLFWGEYERFKLYELYLYVKAVIYKRPQKITDSVVHLTLSGESTFLR